MQSFLIDQEYDRYKEEDHQTWCILCDRQTQLRKNDMCAAYSDGFGRLKLEHTKIALIGDVSERLKSISGWTLVPVSGLIPIREFLTMLTDKVYPVTVPIRRPDQLDFIDRPDIFHDMCGHVPMLANTTFVRFLSIYSALTLKYLDNEKALNLLGRLYWFTCEMGLIREDGEYKAYGGAIITSAQEMRNVKCAEIPKHPFNLSVLLDTFYSYDDLQNEYFSIGSFEEILDSLETLEDELAARLSALVD